jgi:hypothetical protein
MSQLFNTQNLEVMIKVFKDKKIKSLIENICNEHHMICKTEDSNMGYLWYMYTDGTKKGDFKPFIFLSELNLLVKTKYITEDEKQNMLGMLLSDDDDNAHLTGYSIVTLRNKRIEEMGLWTLENVIYKDINYTIDIISPDTFLTKL